MNTKFCRIYIESGGYTQKMHKAANEVIAVVSNIDTRFTVLLSRTVRPDILFTVGPGFPTT
ncbi:vte6-related protein, partial [Nicotiana attenuata]